MVHIDWAGISAGTAITPDVTIPPGVMPTFSDTSKFYVIRVVGNLTSAMMGNVVNTGGRGTLIVTGGVNMTGNNFTWRGVVMVGGDIVGNGNNDIQGAVLTALNAKLGQNVPIDTVNGTKNYQYNSCNVYKSMLKLGSLVPLSNTWVDNWVEY
jgi:hypothetical protein